MSEKRNDTILYREESFFEELFHKHYAELVLFAQNILFDKDEAKDAVQDAFVDLWNQEEDIAIETSIRALLFTCVKNRAFNRIQHLHIIDKHELQVKEAMLAVHQHRAKEQVISPEMQAILDSFPQQMRQIVEYRYFCNWSYQDIAEKMNIKVATVKTQLYRALKRLRAELHKGSQSSDLAFHS